MSSDPCTLCKKFSLGVEACLDREGRVFCSRKCGLSYESNNVPKENKMNWIDAIIEMKKDNSKVFELYCSPRKWYYKIINGKLSNRVTDDPGSPYALWGNRGAWEEHTLTDWVEVKQFKEVDYAEFMEWYCNPNNKGKEYKGIYKCNQVPFIHLNNLDHAPIWFSCDVHGYQIPNE